MRGEDTRKQRHQHNHHHRLLNFHFHMPHLSHGHGYEKGMSHPAAMAPMKKGWMGIRVGQEGEEQQRFVVPVVYLKHPLFVGLLDQAEKEYGFDHNGAITIPCGVDHFRHVQGIIDRDTAAAAAAALGDACDGADEPIEGAGDGVGDAESGTGPPGTGEGGISEDARSNAEKNRSGRYRRHGRIWFRSGRCDDSRFAFALVTGGGAERGGSKARTAVLKP